jgi:hypothetical protein
MAVSSKKSGRAKTGKHVAGGKTAIEYQRLIEAYELRLKGHSYEEIGRMQGVSKQAVHERVKRHMEGMLRDAAEQVLVMELDRLDILIRGAMPAAEKGDPQAALTILRAMDRRTKYLGLDKPAPTPNNPEYENEADDALKSLAGILAKYATAHQDGMAQDADPNPDQSPST